MGTKRWRGDALTTAQVWGGTITAYDVATTYKVTMNGKVVSVIGQGGTVTTTAAALVVALNASTIPEFAEVTWSNVAGAISGTADTAGKPFSVTSSVSGGTGTFGAFSITTANSGPNDCSVAANWENVTTPGTVEVPQAGDDVVIENSSVSLLYVLDTLSATTLTSLTIKQSFTGRIGLPNINADGAISYREYRERYFKAGITTLTIGEGEGGGSGRIKINGSTIQSAVTIYNSGAALDSGLESILWKGTHASNVVNVLKGSVGIAVEAGDTATVATLRVGNQGSVSGDAKVRCGSGVTLTTITKTAGGLEINSAATTITNDAGDLTANGTGAITTLNVTGGTAYVNTSGTVGTANVTGGGALDFSRSPTTKTVTIINRYGNNSKVNDPSKTVGTLIVDLEQSTDLSNITIGTNFKLTRGAVT